MKLLLGVLLLVSSCISAAEDNYSAAPIKERTVRVLLEEAPPEKVFWELMSDEGFELYSESNEHPIILNQPTITIRHTGTSFSLGEQTFTKVTVVPRHDLITCNGIRYEGSIALVLVNDRAYLLNYLSLETYIEGVLPYETVPSWPPEVQKALAIVMRTYALAQLVERSGWDKPYDVVCTVMDQVYRGHHMYDEKPETLALKACIRDTAGHYIAINGQPILAMFSSVCGGVVPGLKKADIFEKAPYLKRVYACNHCAPTEGYYRWHTTLTFDEIEQALPEMSPLEEVRLDEWDDAEIAQHVLLTVAGTEKTMNAYAFRLKLPKLRSTCCTFEVKDRIIYAHGKGYGHHTGFCQWGAYYMVLDGATYEEVVQFYYPGSTIETL